MLRDIAFQRMFSGLFVYNILFEDSELDDRFLEIDERSDVLSITGAGCGVATMVSRQPRTIDAVDINKHHLALSALKITAAQRLKDYETFYSLLGRGTHPDPKNTVGLVANHLPSWMQRYWSRHWGRFARSLYLEGLTSKMLSALRRMSGVDSSWLIPLLDQPVDVRLKAIDDSITPVLNRPLVKMMMASPVQLLALGVNYQQRDRILENEPDDTIVEFFISHLKRLAATDLTTNWFVWWATTGGFNHECPDAVPPYLRKERHQNSLNAPTKVNFHRGNIFHKLESAGANSWSHYTLCDAPDWMPDQVQRHLLNEIFRTSRDGAIVLARSVQEESFIERIDGGKRFQLMEDASTVSTEEDRSRQYRRVDFYRVCH
ncbi:MAG: DUF3419 family protein [Myxococcota bacterium]